MDGNRNGIGNEALRRVLEQALERENELLRTYAITAVQVQGNERLRERLHNFAEGNAKRTRQLMSELESLE